MLIPTAAAKGNVSDEHPQSLGSTLPLTATQELLAAADVVLAVGTELAETDHWTDRLPIKGKLIRIDVDPRSLMRDYKPDVAILADAGTALTALNQKIATRPADIERIAKLRAANAGAYRSLAKKHAKVLDALREVLPDDGIVVSDMTQIAYTGATQFTCRRPRSWFHPQGFGTLGYALPAAIGAKLAAPERAVVAVAGDAGFLFTVQELATAVELELPLAHPALEQRCPRPDRRGHEGTRHPRDRRQAAQSRFPGSRPGLPLPRLPAGEPRGAEDRLGGILPGRGP